MKTLKTIILTILISSVAIACKKDKQAQLSQTGANVMHAKVNGVAWQSKACWSCIAGGSGLSGSYDDRINFGVKGQNNDQKISISINLRKLKAIGTYELSSTDLDFGFVVNTSSSYNSFTTTSINMGIVIITKLDLVNKIISGTFQFTAEDEKNPANTVKVTEGWFDITYR